MKYTIGFDFGTHQTKCCVEERDKNYQKYSFVKFMNTNGVYEYRLPSVIKLKSNRQLEYGFFDTDNSVKVYRYFKQATFNPHGSPWAESIKAEYFSVWYITYVIFCMKEMYGQYFNINIGIPTDSVSYNSKKNLAVGLIKAAYDLGEVVYGNNKDLFLSATLDELLIHTRIESGTEIIRKQYGINVFPEAWSCIRPLLKNEKLKYLNLMVDIGGGTTDISLFSVQGKTVRLYYYTSVNKGLNFLTNKIIKMEEGVPDLSVGLINPQKLDVYKKEIQRALLSFFGKMKVEFLKYGLNISDLNNAINNQPSIFTGGGSVFNCLRTSYEYFTDIRVMSTKAWKLENIEQFTAMNNLCPILSTAYGLAISSNDNTILQEHNLSTLFSNLRGVAEERRKNEEQTKIAKTNYHNDWRDKEYGVLSLKSWER